MLVEDWRKLLFSTNLSILIRAKLGHAGVLFADYQIYSVIVTARTFVIIVFTVMFFIIEGYVACI